MLEADDISCLGLPPFEELRSARRGGEPNSVWPTCGEDQSFNQKEVVVEGKRR